MKFLPFAAMAVLALSACHHQEKKAQQPAATAQAQHEKLIVTDGRLVLPAVPGHPAAAYFTLSNQGNIPISLVGVSVANSASAEMHQTNGGMMQAVAAVPLAPGESAAFMPAGKHVMVFQPAEGLHPGEHTQMTLRFGDGSHITAPLSIEPAGSAAPLNEMGNMNDTDHMKM